MKRHTAAILSLAATGVALATPGARAAGAAPKMNFLAPEAVPAGGTVRRQIEHARRADQMVVVVHEPAACGTRLVSPRVEIEADELRLDYERPGSGEGGCVATGVFTIGDLPARHLAVVARARPAQAPGPIVAAPAAPRVRFLGTAAAPVADAARFSLRHVQNGARLVAVVSEPAACGSRLADASVAYAAQPAGVELHYRVTPAPAGQNCAALGVFSVDGLAAATLPVRARPEHTAWRDAALRPSAPVSSMTFLAAPAAPVPVDPGSATGQSVVSARKGDVLQVIVREPSPCGARASAPSFALEGQRLTIGYRLPAGINSGCVAVTMATFHGLPAGVLDIVAQSHDLPLENVALLP